MEPTDDKVRLELNSLLLLLSMFVVVVISLFATVTIVMAEMN